MPLSKLKCRSVAAFAAAAAAMTAPAFAAPAPSGLDASSLSAAEPLRAALAAASSLVVSPAALFSNEVQRDRRDGRRGDRGGDRRGDRGRDRDRRGDRGRDRDRRADRGRDRDRYDRNRRDHRGDRRGYDRRARAAPPRHYSTRHRSHGHHHGRAPRRGHGYYCNDHFTFHYFSGYSPAGWSFAVHRGYHAPRGCRTVERVTWRGRRRIVHGAVQCVDAWGYPYIVRGSQYVYRTY